MCNGYNFIVQYQRKMNDFLMMTNNRNYALDFMKFMAAVMITNSHFISLYKDVNIGLATFGVHGNALFFFVAGYLLMAGFTKRQHRLEIGLRGVCRGCGRQYFCGHWWRLCYGMMRLHGKGWCWLRSIGSYNV